MDINHAELLKTLLGQHRNLKSHLRHIAEDANGPNGDFSCTEKDILQFHKDLAAHLALEDSVFYPEVFRTLKEANMNFEPTEIFFEEMRGLAKVVEEFLAKYRTAKDIADNKKNFIGDFNDISQKLILRIAAEEEGVYMYLA